MSARRGIPFASVAALLAVVFAAGCGSEDFENKPKPAVPVEATIEISSENVDVSPRTFGAGIATFVIANNSSGEAALTIKGPVDGASSPIPARSNGVYKIALETGTYELAVDGNEKIQPAELKIGPPRAPSNNELLQP